VLRKQRRHGLRTASSGLTRSRGGAEVQ